MKKTVKKRTSIKKGKSLKRKSVKGGTKVKSVGTKVKSVKKGTTLKEGDNKEHNKKAQMSNMMMPPPPMPNIMIPPPPPMSNMMMPPPPMSNMIKEDKKKCPVCLEDITDDDEITLSCTHTFHKTCMTMTCNMPQFDEKTKCNCPMCRKLLTPKELATLGIYFHTIKEFKEYVNTKLEAEYSRTSSHALHVLMNVLEEFIGTPIYFIRGKILEFRLKHRYIPNLLLQNPAVEFTYEFTKNLKEREQFDRSCKYFQYRSDGDPMVNRVFQFIVDEDSD
jgi:hypothetical protein